MWQWQRLSRGALQPAQAGRRRMGRNSRIWLLIGIGLIGIYLAVQFLGGGFSLGGGAGQTLPPGDTTGYLANGYAQLNQSGQQASSTSFWGLWANMLIPLAIVIVAVYAILRGLHYLNRRVAATSAQGRTLESLDTLTLGQQGVIHLVRVGERVVVVGAGAQQISLLTELDAEQAEAVLRRHGTPDSELAGAGPPEPLSARGVLDSFQELLASKMSRPAVAAADTGEGVVASLSPESLQAARRDSAAG